jgi:D-amino peptidase
MVTDPRVTYLVKPRGYQAGEFRWMPGLDRTVDGFLVPAHHAKAGTPGSFLPHTWTLQWADFRINGLSVGEMGIEACFAGHWNIPVMLMSGDEVACKEARSQFPGIVAVPVKRPVDPDHCTGLDPDSAHVLIAKGVTQAVKNLRAEKCKPFAPALPMTVTVRMAKTEDAEEAARKPGVKRLDEFTVEKVLEQRADVVKWLNGTGLKMEKPK